MFNSAKTNTSTYLKFCQDNKHDFKALRNKIEFFPSGGDALVLKHILITLIFQANCQYVKGKM